MKTKYLIPILLSILIPFMVYSAQLQYESLRILSINIWSGIDYTGILSYGEYEDKDRRRLRFNALVSQIKNLNPDIVFIQEANFVGRIARKLAADLGYTEIHQVVNAGIKFGPVGLPMNFKEGLVILARESLSLERADVWKLSGSFGIHGSVFSMHFDESVLALVGRILVNNTPVYLVNVHLHAVMAENRTLIEQYRTHANPDEAGDIERVYTSIERNYKETVRLVGKLQQLTPEIPVIIAGDFNADPDSRSMRYLLTEVDLMDTFEKSRNTGLRHTWDYRQNSNIRVYIDPASAEKDSVWDFRTLKVLSDTVSRRIDYILLSRHFSAGDVADSRIVLASYIGGVQASDHFGMFAEISLSESLADAPKQYNYLTRSERRIFEPLPILMYDTDIGFGYGAKLFLLNRLRVNESFDLTLFNSTKGERWYRFVFSIPDAELRQGKIYPVALDLIVDYDKYIRNSFFGIGNDSSRDDREYYSREPFEVSMSLNRGFTANIVGQARIRYNSIRNFNFGDGSRLMELPPPLSASTVRYVAYAGLLRYDTRDSYIHPTRGIVLQGEAEYAPPASFTNTDFTRVQGVVQYYAELFYPTTILAIRAAMRSIRGGVLPVQVLQSIGGGSTVRGYSQDRFLDRNAGLLNAELRFPLYRRLGGVAGIDMGRVWHSLPDITARGWVYNYVGGLRYYMKTYVVRFDMGFGGEGVGVYFNFGHLF
jgi:endonuclease/exonuclease/phosphatase family metal-dependent hydrolase